MTSLMLHVLLSTTASDAVGKQHQRSLSHGGFRLQLSLCFK